ncbi:hypothetical protein EDC01DRAFT_626411 [Geopyxis carbonaria]|nr:hypothetical protein EDC01DRAFT_626411 [Geopyxis carbonaria]
MLSSKFLKENAPSSKDSPRKRVARACDRCRLKKGKCDGKEQCAKCVSADVMCIYTDRKPPQHKLISPAIAEALQSENLTLKKASIIIFRQLMEARNGEMPKIEGVDWDSEKVASGKSGRALNYIISQEARVDNRITNEEIANYDSDTQMLDSNSRQRPDSPGSRQSSPQSTVGDNSPVFWSNSVRFDGSQQVDDGCEQIFPRKRKASRVSKYAYSPASESPSSVQANMHVPQSSATTFIDPNLLQPSGSISSTFSHPHPPTPPTGLESSTDFISMSPAPIGEVQMQWASQQQQQHPGFFNNSLVMQRYPEESQQSRASSANIPTTACCDDQGTVQWNAPEFYQFMAPAEKNFRRVFDSMEAPMIYDSALLA